MEIYEIGYWSHHEAPKILLTNEKIYTKEEFDDLVVDIILMIEFGVCSSFEFILNDIIKILKENYNFREIKSTVSVNPFGWSELNDDDPWRDISKDDDIFMLKEKIKKKMGIK